MGFSQSSMAKRRGAFPDGFFSLSSVSSVVNKKFYGGKWRILSQRMTPLLTTPHTESAQGSYFSPSRLKYKCKNGRTAYA